VVSVVLISTAFMTFMTNTVLAQGPAPVDRHLGWWKDARFGMFIHWGPISQKGEEISWSRDPNPSGANPSGIAAAEYDSLYKTFDPVYFNAKAIVSLAKAAGMKYIVLVCKHHDGFCEFDSKYTDYKITSPLSPYGKDIVRQMADATHAAGLHWCVYYSQPDLHNPDYKVDQAAYDTYFHSQVHELLTNYEKVDLIWFDGLGGSAEFWDAQNLFKQMRAATPDLIINNRCGFPGDYYTPEQTIGAYDDQHPWETCMTIGDQWAYKPGDNYKSTAQCIQTLAKCVGGDGNLLLNIGPKPDGSIDPTQADRLRGIAIWMKTHGDSIYGTRGGPYLPTASYAATRKGNIVYVHVLHWQSDSLELPPLSKTVLGSKVLGGGTVKVKQSSDGITIVVPESSRDAADTVIELKLDGSAMDISPIAALQAIKAKITASNVYQNDAEYAPGMAYDESESTRWATDGGTKSAWWQADFDKTQNIIGVSIHEAYAGRVQNFDLQYKSPDGVEWITILTGTTLGANYEIKFPAIAARSFRLNILDSTDGPTISEISFYRSNIGSAPGSL
jgi:alpha-L-fucosidase